MWPWGLLDVLSEVLVSGYAEEVARGQKEFEVLVRFWFNGGEFLPWDGICHRFEDRWEWLGRRMLVRVDYYPGGPRWELVIGRNGKQVFCFSERGEDSLSSCVGAFHEWLESEQSVLRRLRGCVVMSSEGVS